MTNQFIHLGNKLILFYVCSILLTLFLSWKLFYAQEVVDRSNQEYSESSMISSIHMYECIKKYAHHYDIPEHIAFNVAYLETGYRGPLHFGYSPDQISGGGAVGPMQVLPKTASFIEKKKVSRVELLTNIDMNVHISLKYLKHLHNEFGSWPLAVGFYNTGTPVVNEYSRYCTGNKAFSDKWLRGI
jgi:soluble lytic murein transglycosylase-like protein